MLNIISKFKYQKNNKMKKAFFLITYFSIFYSYGNVKFRLTCNSNYLTGEYIKFFSGFMAYPDIYGLGSTAEPFVARIDPNLCNIYTQNSAKISASYKPMLSNTNWYAIRGTFEGPINSVFEVIKDSIINGVTYKKIRETHVDLPNILSNPYQGIGVSPNKLLLREDITQRKVYQWNNFNVENLLFDFSLNLGATHPNETSFILTTRDSILTNTGFNNRLIFTHANDSIIWIEGLGNQSAPFINYAGYPGKFFPGTSLICAYQNNSLVYSNNSIPYVTCSSFVGLQDLEEKQFKINISPNPSTGKVHIVLPPPIEQLVEIEVLDCYGRSVFKTKTSKNIYEIDLGQLAKGVYSLKIKAFNQVFQSKIVLIE
jgi:Secretion system C-terminal sorting domain